MSQYSNQKKLRETAIAWFLQMQQVDFEHPDRIKFEAWLMQSHSHQQAYTDVVNVWEGFDSKDDLISLNAAMSQKLFLDKQKRTQKLNQILTGVLSVAILGIASLLAYQSWQAHPVLEVIQTAQIGEMKHTTLEDGTKLNINANSELEVTYYRDRRIAKLKRGEVIFEVARDENRPFIVDSGYGRVTVLGTRFAVNRLKKLVRVSVDSGRVQVDAVDEGGNAIKLPIILTNGGVAEIHQNQQIKRTNQSASDAFGFINGTIIFDKAGFEEIAETLSRYRKPQLSTATQNFNEAEITAIIKVKEVEKFIANLPNLANVKITSSPQGTVITSQPSDQ